GPFQAHNLLAALGLAIAGGVPAGRATDALTGLRGVPGRMQRIARRDDGAMAFVDYAHTPDALEKALTALRAHLDGRLIVVFGCGGDRDRGKRPEMGRIAERLADVVIVTDDNPRSEDPAAIRAEILAGMRREAVEIGDRAEAIARGWSMLAAGDGLLVAGKGHETGQIVGDAVLPFDDAEVLRNLAAGAGA
ncbi:MAG TPA: UDP-N-acetylmuramoyl-L-alanyl-D-glutamate--2,6-diaminopimelate ligase, partial [Rhodospirillales bacterium]|nr:UDP-N-acetylmuramoyl-L-alanyl-D-glutamate--2,6-diaminopimelate ligase [Rhodospirillales bacterium]